MQGQCGVLLSCGVGAALVKGAEKACRLATVGTDSHPPTVPRADVASV